MQLISDLHVHTRNIRLLNFFGKTLFMCGDIGNPFHHTYKDVIYHAAKSYDRVILITGNHEYKNNYSISDTNNHIYDLCSKYNNLTFLNDTSTTINNKWTILGTTLWPNIERCRHLHIKNLRWLTKEINSSNMSKKIVLTHYPPSLKLAGITKNHSRWDRITCDIDHLIKDPITLWCSGHLHRNVVNNINGIRCIINAQTIGNTISPIKVF
jgi:predicted phosphohydrolase